MGRFVHRIQTPTERDGHRSVFDALEFRIVSLVGQSDLKAVSGSAGHLVDPGQMLQDLLDNVRAFD